MKKILKISDLKKLRKKFFDKKIALVHGVFDLFHLGHLIHLKEAKKKCDILIVSVTTERFVNKGPGRPYYNDAERLEILSSVALIDFLVLSNKPTSEEILKQLKPDYYIKGKEYEVKQKDHTGKIYNEERATKKSGGKLVFTEGRIFSSSNLLNRFFINYTDEQKKYLRNIKNEISFDQINEILRKIKNKKILIIGDTIFDKYIFCETLGKSPKESIISVKKIRETVYGGGILATANHISNFSKHVTLLSVAGIKDKAKINSNRYLNTNVSKKFFYLDDTLSIYKSRFIEIGSDNKLFQFCNKEKFTLLKIQEKKIIDFLNENIKSFDCVIVNDFGHGLLTNRIKEIIQKKSKYLCLNVQTNSSNSGFNYVTNYKKANYITLDEPEARLALQDKTSKTDILFNKLKKKIKFNLFSITFGKNGTSIYDNKKINYAPALTNKTVDTLGAGDAYFAISSLFSIVEKKNKIIAFVGNIAGSMKTQYIGHSEYIQKKNFLSYIKTLLS